MAKRRWPKGARVARPGRLAIEKLPNIEKRAREQKTRSDLAPVRIKTRWRCKSMYSFPYRDFWAYQDELGGKPLRCPVCQEPMKLLPGVIAEAVVRCPGGSPDADSRRDP